jgi:uncharacterized protein YfiM (DUF2279 family)
VKRHSVGVLAIAVLLTPPSIGALFGADKLKHFFMSALVQSAAYSSARAVGMDRTNAQVVGVVSTTGIALLKEVHDKRNGQPFSVADLVWDAAGATAAASVLNGTR